VSSTIRSQIEVVRPPDVKRDDWMMGKYHYMGETRPVGDFLCQVAVLRRVKDESARSRLATGGVVAMGSGKSEGARCDGELVGADSINPSEGAGGGQRD